MTRGQVGKPAPRLGSVVTSSLSHFVCRAGTLTCAVTLKRFAVRQSTGAIMTNHVIRNVFFAASLSAAMPLAADPVGDPQAAPPAGEVPVEALAREVQTVIDAILKHHIDPPTRQELWLAGAKAVLTRAGVVQYPGLSAEVSGLSSSNDFAQFAKRLWSNESIQKQVKSVAAFQQNFIDGVLA